MSRDAWESDDDDNKRVNGMISNSRTVTEYVPIRPDENVDLGGLRRPLPVYERDLVPQTTTVLRRELGDGLNSKIAKERPKNQTSAQKEREYQKAKARIFKQADKEKEREVRESAKALRGKPRARGNGMERASASLILSSSKAELRKGRREMDPDFNRDYSRYAKRSETQQFSYQEEFPKL